MLISVAAGACIGAGAQLLGASFNGSVMMCVIAIGFVEIIGALRYRKEASQQESLAKGTLYILFYPVALFLFWFIICRRDIRNLTPSMRS